MTPADPDMFALPDPDSLIQLPWKKEVAWLASDLYINGKPVKASPKVILKSQINEFNKTEKLDKSKPVSDWERKNTLDC
jgi:glutamine synthetase